MPKKTKASKPLTGCNHPGFLSFAAAAPLSTLVALSFWGFELRSFAKLSLYSTLTLAVIWPLLYFLFFRKFNQPIQVDLMGLLSALVTALLFGGLITPAQVNQSRYILALALTTLLFMFFYLAFLLPILRMQGVHWERILHILASLCGAGGLLILLFNTFSSRIYADDFCYAIQLADLGFWRASLGFYLDWSGRFFSNFLVMGLSNFHMAQFIFLIAVVISLYLFLSAILDVPGWSKALASLAGALLLTLTVMTVIPDLYKSLYWNGSAMVVLPILVLIPPYLLLLALLQLDRLRARGYLWAIVILLGITLTTTHEVAAVGWVVMHALALLWLHFSASKNPGLRTMLAVGLFAALVGLAVLYFSPGAANRAAEQQFPAGRSLPYLISKMIEDFFYFITHISVPYYTYQLEVRPGWLLIASAAGLGWLLDAPFQRRVSTALGILLITLAVVMVSFFPGGYIYSGRIPERTQFIPSTFLVLGVFVAAMFLPCFNDLFLKKALTLLIGMLLLFGAGASISEMARTIEPMRRYAAAWDARDAGVRLNRETPQRIPIPWDEFEQEMGCIREYYQYLK